ncbi:hypothetical protein [Bifidobacterium tsurumiense]|uniref:ApeA N-terminal domain-containing protein n=1 Tax=Bifidobacterium tsurumiense TaxID=356829 RepID=A0A087EI33_9BIFI|nr:hypothetical protein [Bifidobacterium tsurumiense]KFJ07434.1 hypothetical protein BITS_0670 [Bifidobacterium tsurumiense]
MEISGIKLDNGDYEIQWHLPVMTNEGTLEDRSFSGRLQIGDRAEVRGEVNIVTSEGVFPNWEQFTWVKKTEDGRTLYSSTIIPLLVGRIFPSNKLVLLSNAVLHLGFNKIYISAQNGFISLGLTCEFDSSINSKSVEVESFCIALNDVRFIVGDRAVDIFDTDDVDSIMFQSEDRSLSENGNTVEQFMPYCVKPLQTICSFIANQLLLIDFACVVLETNNERLGIFQVIGESIRNCRSLATKVERPADQVYIDGLVVSKMLAKWQQNSDTPIIRNYASFVLSEAELANFRYLLLIQSLESLYDVVDEGADEQKSEGKLARKLKSLFDQDKNNDKLLNKRDRKKLLGLVKQREEFLSLQVKLKSLFAKYGYSDQDLDTTVFAQNPLFDNQALQSIDVFAALARIRNKISHGEYIDFGPKFPSLVNSVESICRGILFKTLGAPDKYVDLVEDFHGWKYPKETISTK